MKYRRIDLIPVIRGELRALKMSGARVALVMQVSDSARRAEMQGIITEREITKVACATAQLTG